jgi:catechol 2,3-dioxygenase-like lactoylglutathione lyase family enzyme
MIIPTMSVSDIQRALDIYTGVLDFSAAYVWSDGGAHGYAVLRRGNDELTWGTRAFYADDPDGNAVIFQKR